MTTVLLIVGGLILALVVLDWIPGVRHLISPVVSAAGSGIEQGDGGVYDRLAGVDDQNRDARPQGPAPASDLQAGRDRPHGSLPLTEPTVLSFASP